MLCCSRISLEHTTEAMASLSEPFIKWYTYSRKTIKRETRLPESSVGTFLPAGQKPSGRNAFCPGGRNTFRP